MAGSAGRSPGKMFTFLSAAAIEDDKLVYINTTADQVAVATSVVGLGGEVDGVTISGASAAGAELDVDLGPSIAQLTCEGTITKGDLVIAGASGGILNANMGEKEVTVANATEIWTSAAHGYVAGTPVTLRNEEGALPAGTAAGVIYYVGVVTTNTFILFPDAATSLTATDATGAVDATGDGTGTHFIRKAGVINLVGKAMESGVTDDSINVLWNPQKVRG